MADRDSRSVSRPIINENRAARAISRRSSCAPGIRIPYTPKVVTTATSPCTPSSSLSYADTEPQDTGHLTIKQEDVGMTVRHPDTENSAPMVSLPVPLHPGRVLIPSTPTQSQPDPIESWTPETQIYTQPSPTPDLGTVYTDAIAKIPYKIELEEAMTSNGISRTPPVFGDESQQRHTRDTHNLLTIIAQLTADQKSMTDSTLKTMAMVDRCLSNDVANIAERQNTHTRAIKAIEESLGNLDRRLAKEEESSRRQYYFITESLLEIKEMIAQGPRPSD